MNYFETLASFQLSTIDWLAVIIAILILGMAKAGIKGFGVIIVVVLAFVFDEKPSTGIL